MWICERLGFVVSVLAALAVGAGCAADGGDCFRYSDCAQGLTCAYGRCVVPPAPDPSDGESAALGDGGLSGFESGSDEASSDDGSSLGFEAGSLGDDGAAAE